MTLSWLLVMTMRPADRPAALADDRLDRDRAAEADADHAAAVSLVVAEQHVLAGRPRRRWPFRRSAARPGPVSLIASSNCAMGVVKGSPKPTTARVSGPSPSFSFRISGSVSTCRQSDSAVDVKRMDANARHLAHQHRQARLALDLPVAADDALGGAADQRLRVQLEPEVFHERLGLVAMVGGEENEDHVGLQTAIPGGPADLGNDLLDGLGCGSILTDSGMESHGVKTSRPLHCHTPAGPIGQVTSRQAQLAGRTRPPVACVRADRTASIEGGVAVKQFLERCDRSARPGRRGQSG